MRNVSRIPNKENAHHVGTYMCGSDGCMFVRKQLLPYFMSSFCGVNYNGGDNADAFSAIS